MLLLTLFTFAVISSSTPSTIEYNEIRNADDVTIKNLWWNAPNGSPYLVGRIYYSEKLKKKYIETKRKPDIDNPVKDKDGNIRYYPFLPTEQKIKKVNSETNNELIMSIVDLQYGTTSFKGGEGGFALIGFTGIMALIMGLILGVVKLFRRKK